jgi:hypothetical protein
MGSVYSPAKRIYKLTTEENFIKDRTSKIASILQSTQKPAHATTPTAPQPLHPLVFS